MTGKASCQSLTAASVKSPASGMRGSRAYAQLRIDLGNVIQPHGGSLSKPANSTKRKASLHASGPSGGIGNCRRPATGQSSTTLPESISPARLWRRRKSARRTASGMPSRARLRQGQPESPPGCRRPESGFEEGCFQLGALPQQFGFRRVVDAEAFPNQFKGARVVKPQSPCHLALIYGCHRSVFRVNGARKFRGKFDCAIGVFGTPHIHGVFRLESASTANFQSRSTFRRLKVVAGVGFEPTTFRL